MSKSDQNNTAVADPVGFVNGHFVYKTNFEVRSFFDEPGDSVIFEMFNEHSAHTFQIPIDYLRNLIADKYDIEVI